MTLNRLTGQWENYTPVGSALNNLWENIVSVLEP